MVSVSNLVNNGLLLVSQAAYQDVATPEQAAVEQFNILNFLGGAAPYIQYDGFGISTLPPDTCTVEQVQLMSRHGERYPTTGKNEDFEKVLKHIGEYNGTLKGSLAFLNDYTYFVTDDYWLERETTPENAAGVYAGTTDLAIHGAYFRSRYDDLFNDNQTLPVFTSNADRVYVSAQAFISGFFGQEYKDSQVDWNILNEDGSLGANSLTPRYACLTYDEDANLDLVDSFPTGILDDIADRLKSENDDSLNVDAKDVGRMFDMCAYELNVRGQSDFCNIFTNDEFVWKGYYENIDTYYSSSAGNNMTKVIGSVILEASLKLLKEDSDNKIWLSFAHDTDWDIFHSALGLFNPEKDLPVDRIDFRTSYQHARILPQGARIYTEKLKCGNDSYVRYIVNDAVIPIESCQDGPGYSCQLDDFEEYVNSRLEGVDFAEQCNVPSNESTEVTFYWDYTEKVYNASIVL